MKRLISLFLIILCFNSYSQQSINKRVINSKEIRNSGASNLAELLSKISALDVINMPFISSGVGINGVAPTLDNSSVAILQDGRPIPIVNISNIALINIDKIEIIKGAVGAVYGLNALGGAINIITKKGKENSTALGLGYGSFNKYLFQVYKGVQLEKNLYYHISYQNERQKKDYKIGANNFFSPSGDQEIILDPASNGARMLNSAYNKTYLSAGMGYIINDNWDIYFDANGYKHKNSKISGSFYQTAGSSSIKDYDQGTGCFSLGMNGQIKKHNISVNTQYINFTDKIELNESDEKLEEDTKHIYASIKDRYEAKNFNITATLEYRNNKYDDFYHSYPYEDVVHKTPSFKDQTLSASLGGHISLCNEKLNIDAAIRYDRIKYSINNTLVQGIQTSSKDSKTSGLISPYICLTYKLSKTSSMFLDGGISYNKPLSLYKTGLYWKYSKESEEEIKAGDGLKNIIRNYFLMGSDSFDEEKRTTINIGYKHTTDKLNIKLNGFYSENTDYYSGTMEAWGFPSENPYSSYVEKTINEKTYYIQDRIAHIFTSSEKQSQSGLDIYFSYKFDNTIVNNCIITPYYMGTILFNDDLYNYQSMGSNTNISNFGINLNHKDKLFCNINMRITSEKKVRNIFMGTLTNNNDTNGIFDGSFNYETPSYSAIKDINNKPIRPELVGKNKLDLPAYGILNFSTTYNVTDNMSLAFYANNILNENYMDIDAYHMPGRNFLIKLVFNFDPIF